MVQDADAVQVCIWLEGTELLKVTGNDGMIEFPLEKWRRMMEQAVGKALEVEVSVWNGQYPEGVRFQPFGIEVKPGTLDEWIVYRLIEPGYEGWRQLGIYQRNVGSFVEREVVSNKTTISTCINCHHFANRSSDKMMFHARGSNGGTLLYQNGEVQKINMDRIGPKKNATYPAWHPEGRLIAFSSNTTRQVFFGQGQQPIEVYDKGSDLIFYDTETGTVMTDERFLTQEVMETFPSWSPDGKTLFYVAADSKDLQVNREQVHYSLMRVSFDNRSMAFGEKTDTLYYAKVQGGSISYPRVSPDNRYVLCTKTNYGTFPIWHPEADLWMMDLETMEPVDVSVWNDARQADSYHSWSSDGRWVMYGSRRLDGRFTRLYFAYWDETGKPHKPFLLPQKDPRHNTWRLKSYNVPEFVDGEINLPEHTVELFESEDKLIMQ